MVLHSTSMRPIAYSKNYICPTAGTSPGKRSGSRGALKQAERARRSPDPQSPTEYLAGCLQAQSFGPTELASLRACNLSRRPVTSHATCPTGLILAPRTSVPSSGMRSDGDAGRGRGQISILSPLLSTRSHARDSPRRLLSGARSLVPISAVCPYAGTVSLEGGSSLCRSSRSPTDRALEISPSRLFWVGTAY